MHSQRKTSLNHPSTLAFLAADFPAPSLSFGSDVNGVSSYWAIFHTAILRGCDCYHQTFLFLLAEAHATGGALGTSVSWKTVGRLRLPLPIRQSSERPMFSVW